MNQELTESNFISDSDIAIIGMSCRFPGANNPERFWSNLRDGVESVSWFEDEEVLAEGVDESLLKNPNYVKAGSVVEDIDKFDAFFFDINSREAAIIDPQHRIFLECASEAMEKAGYDTFQDNHNAIGLYAGVDMNSYFINNVIPNLKNSSLASGYQAYIGNDKDFAPTRVSYKLNLKGPSINVNTACSSSLVAVHLACQSLLSGECDMAMAGGVSIYLPQKAGYLYQEGMIMSPDGHCRSFDAQAKGTIGASGAGIVVLKRLADAIADGDNIEAVIKGSAINNDGAIKIGYTAPSIEGQAAVISEAMAIADVEPETISYIEAHGTATELGDPIEIAALTKAFRVGTDEKQYCAIGSAKSNFGHLGTAAGVAGLIKTALALKHKQIPPSLHFQKPNPKIDFANSPFFVNNKLTDWNRGDLTRRAGVSSFGIGGTNAHLVLEEAPSVQTSTKSDRPNQLLLVSAKTSSALDTATQNLATHLEENPEINLADVAYTLQVGRRTFEHRRMVVCSSVAAGAKALKDLAPQQVFTKRQEDRDHPVVFMFSGQGSQYPNMGKELYENEPVFKAEIDRCCEILQPQLCCDLRSIIYPTAAELETARAKLKQTAIAQPALFIIEYGLAQLWMSWGIQPQSAIGHSIGEYVAATISGVFSLEDALSLVAHRGRLMQKLPPGAMVAVSLSVEEVKPLLGDNLYIATINAPKLTVVSGTIEAVAAFEQKLESQGIDFRHLHTSHGFHSPMMEPILDVFTRLVAKVQLNSPKIPYLSNVTGTWIKPDEATDPIYWAKHIRQTVRFSEGLQNLLTESAPILLEVGAGRTLCTLAKRHLDKSSSQTILNSLPHAQDDTPAQNFILNTLGQLWLAGAKIDWNGFHSQENRYRLPLPTYPFERQRYWLDVPQEKDFPVSVKPQSLGKKPDLADWFYLPTWKSSVVSPYQSQQLAKQYCWLVFVDELGIASELLNKLENQNVIFLKIGTGFSKLDNQTFTINPTQMHDYQTLFEVLRSLNQLPDKIIHFWSITKPNKNKTKLQQVERTLELGFDSLFYLAQTLGQQNIDKKVDLTVVSHSMQSITGEEIIHPEQATLLGTVKVIEQEYPQINCQSVDFVLPQNGNLSRVIDQLWGELTTQKTETIVAYRGNHRWLQTYEPITLEPAVQSLSRLKQGGVYLITGGLGGTGLILANHLAKSVQAKLVLIGRSNFPVKNEWSPWLANHPEDDRTSLKIKQLQAIEQLGSEVLTFSADITSLEQMQTVVNSVKQTWGAINGVIHTAGLPGTTVIQRKTLAEARKVLAPKVQGTIVLETIFQKEALDFMVLFSSINAVTGGFGQVDYCAANAFLDAFAHSNANNPNRFVTSINWDAWQEVGMAVNTEVTRGMKTAQEQTVKQGLLPLEGVDVFSRILGSVLSQVLVSTVDFSSRIASWKDSNFPEGKDIEEILPESHHPRPDLSSIYVAPGNGSEQAIAKIWQKHIGVDKVGIHDNFFDLGGDSLIGLQVVEKLNREFDTKLPATTIYKAPTVSSIAQLIQPSTTEKKSPAQRRSRGERRREKKIRQRT